MSTQKACGHAVQNGSRVANWDHRELSYDAVHRYHPLIVSVFAAVLSRIQLVQHPRFDGCQPICQQIIQTIKLAIQDSRRTHNLGLPPDAQGPDRDIFGSETSSWETDRYWGTPNAYQLCSLKYNTRVIGRVRFQKMAQHHLKSLLTNKNG